MAKGPEAAVKADVKKYLDSIGAYWFMPVQFGYGAPTLDFLVCYRGFFFAIECKRPGKTTPTPRQHQVAKQIAAAGGRAVVTDDVGAVRTMIENAVHCV